MGGLHKELSLLPGLKEPLGYPRVVDCSASGTKTLTHPRVSENHLKSATKKMFVEPLQGGFDGESWA